MAAPLKHWIEYLLLRAGLGLVNALPLRLALALAWPLAWVTHWIFRFRVAETRRRIRAVLGEEVPAARVRDYAWKSWRNLCFSVIEMARFARTARGDIERTMLGIGTVLAEVDRMRGGPGNGMVLATIHMGNWELGGLAMSMRGMRLIAITRRQKNRLSDEYLRGLRERAGMDVVMRDRRVMKNIIAKLRQGGILAILPDVRMNTPALDIAYLGGRANLAGGMAMFAKQTEFPVLPAYGIRVGWTRHKWILLDPVYPDPSLDKKEDWLRMTQAVMDQFSEVVRQHPDQYFWHNRRWVLDPIEEQ
jgi:Kdo2-lipid IVA lauroyltransferase/acyltransferase